ncbi:winged helix-turn-helix domain-containing protein [Microbacteriaceae bacterium 4G12]
MVQQISPALARRVALAAQGFGRAPASPVGTRQLNLLIQRLRVLQIDSVNVFERSHYLPVFARLGGYDRALLDRLLYQRGSGYVEYWAHEAAFLPVTDWPLFRWRMADTRNRQHSSPDAWPHANGALLDWLRAELADKGPLPARMIEHDANVRKGNWWGWSDVKLGLEYLFSWGEVVSAGRNRFERIYALAEQVLPPPVHALDVPREDALRELVRRSAVALGIGTRSDIADYFRLGTADTVAAIRDLEDSGDLVPVQVPGWERNGSPQPTWLARDARLPRRMEHVALLSPFDPVVWRRERALRMFDFHYRIEIYTPEPKRVYGYYVLPVLVDDRLVGRIDLKSDRQAGVLRVQSAWTEDGGVSEEQVERIAAVLRETAGWQGLDGIAVTGRGDLSPALSAVLA